MATVGKEAERAELHKTIWRIANDLRGSVDGWDFKTYVLGTLFYRFISENLTAYLQTEAFRAEKAKHVTRSKVKRVSGESLARLRIPVPPPDEQERIVSILDEFAALVNDLSIDLPAELSARQQQYEHYRERLLTFSEAA